MGRIADFNEWALSEHGDGEGLNLDLAFICTVGFGMGTYLDIDAYLEAVNGNIAGAVVRGLGSLAFHGTGLWGARKIRTSLN